MNKTLNVSRASASSLGTISIIQLTCYSVIVFIGTVGNFLICLAICRQKKHKPCEYFILNLAITDLAASAISIPLDMIEMFAGYFPFGMLVCKIIYPFQTIVMAVSVATLLSMSLERHRAIVHPLKPRVKGSMTIGAIILIWVASALLISPYIVVLKYDGKYCGEEWPGEEYIKAYTSLLFVMLYLVPLLVITVAYVRIGRKLHGDMKRLKNVLMDSVQSCTGRLIMKKRTQRNSRIVKIFVTAVAAFAICMLPNHILWIWHDFGTGSSSTVFSEILPFGSILVYANSCINPFIFGTLQARCCTLKTVEREANSHTTKRRRFSMFSLRFSLSSSYRYKSATNTSSGQRHKGWRPTSKNHCAMEEHNCYLVTSNQKASNERSHLVLESNV